MSKRRDLRAFDRGMIVDVPSHVSAKQMHSLNVQEQLLFTYPKIRLLSGKVGLNVRCRLKRRVNDRVERSVSRPEKAAVHRITPDLNQRSFQMIASYWMWIPMDCSNRPIFAVCGSIRFYSLSNTRSGQSIIGKNSCGSMNYVSCYNI